MTLEFEFPDRLRKRRMMLDLSQADLARLIHRATKTVSRWETGETQPQRVEDFDQLADVLDIDIDELDPDGTFRSKCSDLTAGAA